MRHADRGAALDRLRRREGAVLAAIRPPGRDRRRLELAVLPQLRAGGAATVYFDLYMKYRVGKLVDPLSTEQVINESNELFDLAVARTGCSTPSNGRERALQRQLPGALDGGVGSVPGRTS